MFRYIFLLAWLMLFDLYAQGNQLDIPNKLPTRSSEESDIPSAKPMPTAHEIEEGHVLLQVVNSFIQAVKQGASTQAYYAYTSDQFRKTTKYKDFKIFVDRFPTLSRNSRFDLLDINHFEDNAAVTGNAVSIDHVENTVSFDLTYEDGRWRILGIQVYAKRVESE